MVASHAQHHHARLSKLAQHLSAAPTAAAAIIDSGAVVLFQGDSITDAGRSRESQSANSQMGQGYAMMISARLLTERPADGLQCYNRGVGGDRIVNVFARTADNCPDGHIPDVISLLIGVNDTTDRGSPNSNPNGVPLPKFETVYRLYLEEMRQSNPAVQFVLCHPFVLDCGNINATGYASWRADIDARRTIVDKLAAEFGAVAVVDFQSMFDEAVKTAPPEFWGADGVHPSHAGHMLMAETWLEAVVGKV